jgi:DNA polymerase I
VPLTINEAPSRPPVAPLPPWQRGDLFDPDTVVWVTTEAALAGLVSALEDRDNPAAEIVMDLETTGLDEYATSPVPARIVLASLTVPRASGEPGLKPITYVVPLYHPESVWVGTWRKVLWRIISVIRRDAISLVNHNLKFDLRWIFAHTGIDLAGLTAWDTQIGAHLSDENASTKLKDRAPMLFGIPPWNDFDLSTPGAALRVPLIDLALYAARDTYWTWRLARLQREVSMYDEEPPTDPDEESAYRLGKLARHCAMPTSATLTRIENRGFLLDRDWTYAKRAELEAERERTLAELLDAVPPPTGMEVSFAPTSKFFAAWTESACQRGQLRVAALTPGGRPQWNKAVLVRQKNAGSAVADSLLTHRQAVKRLEYIASWLSLAAPDGAVHATYHAGRVVTGRLSSSDPNMQQVTSSLKGAFLPRPGYLIAELDYSQVELRVAAFISRCEPMMEAFRQGLDLHRLLASRIVGKEARNITKEERQGGKSANFGLLYGMSAAGFREYAETVYGVSFTDSEAEIVRATFFSMWQGMAEWHHRAISRARQDGEISSPIGRIRRLPEIDSSNGYQRSHAERNAINSPVQGFASDLMQMAGASVLGFLPGSQAVPGVHLDGTVHDSLVAEVPADDWQRATGRVMHRMLNITEHLKYLGCHFDVPLAVEATVGTRWGAGDVGVIEG